MEFLWKRLSLTFWKRLYKSQSLESYQPYTVIHIQLTYVFTGDGVDNIIWWCSEELSDDGELVYMILSGKQRLAFEHLCENTSRTPNINFHIVFLPSKHDLWCSVVSCRDISGHLRILNTSETEIADLEIAVLVDKNVAGLEITMNNPCGVNIFQSTLEMILARVFRVAQLRWDDLPEFDTRNIEWIASQGVERSTNGANLCQEAQWRSS